MRHIPALLCIAALLGPVAASTAFAQVPARVPIQGTLYDLDGEPIDGTLPVDFTLYADPSGVESLWSDTMSVDFVQGIFTAYLGSGDPIDPITFREHAQVFVGIAVDGDSEMDLFALATAPYAAMAAYAGDAALLDGRTASDIQAAAVAAADGRDDVLNEAQVDAFVENNGFLRTVAWSGLMGIPAGFADGIDNDTQLNEAQVDDFVADNGYVTSITWGAMTGIPGGFADGIDNDTQLSEADVDAMVSDNGFLTSVLWGSILNVPAGFADGIDNDTNTQLNEAQVDAMVANNGYRGAGTGVELYDCARDPVSGWHNGMDAVLNASCPAGKVMQGLNSYHNNGTEDRQWAYYCCSLRLQ